MVDHAAREHAQWSASATDRNWNCPGALALTDNLPETTSEAADWGTCCHQIAERCLTTGKNAADFIGEDVKAKKYEFVVDEEMAETAQTYVDYVLAAHEGTPGATLHIEQKFSLAALNPPFEAGGTADAVIFYPDAKLIEVVDLKGGRGHVVEVIGNPQLRTYALGAMLANKGLPVETVRVTIVQPRAPHKSGRIRSETFSVVDLLEWTNDLLIAMGRSKRAVEERDLDDMTEARWSAEFLRAGDHCKFCKAAGFCPALKQKTYDAASVWFDDLNQPRLANSPGMLSPEEAAEVLNASDMIEDWIGAVRAYWHQQAEAGIVIPGYQLVDRIGRRKWTISDDEAVTRLQGLGVEPWTKKVVSPAQAEKLLGTKRKAEISGLIEKPVTGTNLVRTDKTTRPAVASSAERYFEPTT